MSLGPIILICGLIVANVLHRIYATQIAGFLSAHAWVKPIVFIGATLIMILTIIGPIF